jgi:acetolactate synthase regulatory subunit
VNLVKPVKNSLRKKDEYAKSIIVDFKMESVESVLVSVLRRGFTVLLKNVFVVVRNVACKSVNGNVV